jgi:hypothetical protein
MHQKRFGRASNERREETRIDQYGRFVEIGAGTTEHDS